MAELAKRAGMNRSTIYRYYSSLYEVLGDCIYQYAGKADQNVPQASDPDFWEVVRDNYVNSARDIVAHGKLYNLLFRYPSEFPADSPHVMVLKRHSDDYYRLLVDQLLVRYPVCRVPRDYLEVSLARLSGGALEAWIEGGCVESLDCFADSVLLMSRAVVHAVMSAESDGRDD